MPESEWVDVGERVQLARTARGLSQAELAAALGLDRTMIAKIEAGSRRVDALELSRLANVLDVAMAYFLESRPLVLSRRGLTVTDDIDTAAGRDSGRLDLALDGWIREIRQLIDWGVLTPRPIRVSLLPTADVDSARAVAIRLRNELGRGAEPIDSMMALCEQAGQFVLVTDVNGDGASAVDGEVAAAVVSRTGDPGRRRATAARELGHLVLGDEYSSDLGVHATRGDREAVVDAFAAELLLPAAVLAARTPPTREGLLEVAARYRTSWSLTLKQAAVAGLGPIPKAWSRSNPTRAEFLDALGWAPQPDLESVRVPPAVAGAVMRAWRADLITRRRAVEFMHGQLDDGDLPVDTGADLEP